MEETSQRLSFTLRRVHEIKLDSALAHNVRNGSKTHEFRKNDRDYGVGDLLIMRAWDMKKDAHVSDGEFILAHVTYISHGPAYGIPDGYCVMSIRVVAEGYSPDAMPF